MNICFGILCILSVISPCNILVKFIMGMVLCVLFDILKRDTNLMQTFARVLAVACLEAINFVYVFIRSDFLCLRNGIVIAILLNCIMSVYILSILLIVVKIRSIR